MFGNENLQYEVLEYEAENRAFMTKVYGWMFIGLIVTGIVSFLTSTSEQMLRFVFGNPIAFFGLFIVELVLVGYLSGWVKDMSAGTATFTYLAYSAINGLTISVIFLVYSLDSIFTTFFITALTFGAMSLYGYTTKRDLTSWGNLLFMALIGLILASIANTFLGSETVYWITTYIGVIVFVGLTAYDTQKISEMNVYGNEGTDEDTKEAIVGALALYLDFINLFLYLLRIFGRRK